MVVLTDRIVLNDMRFLGHHGVEERERAEAQPFGVDVELALDLEPAARDDELARTIDYGAVFATCRRIVETSSFRLIEALAEAIADAILAEFPVPELVVRVRKLEPPIVGDLAWAGVEIRRSRATGSPGASRG